MDEATCLALKLGGVMMYTYDRLDSSCFTFISFYDILKFASDFRHLNYTKI